jgi:hypothetical protein
LEIGLIILPNYDILGSGNYLWRGVAPKRNIFVDIKFADQTIKKPKYFFTQPQILIEK